jgi:drug/metabolite transporter (DMT)-like permease
MSAFVFSLQLTAVFNALMMLSMAPLLAAALAWLVLREPVRKATWIAIVLAIVGVLVMVWDGLRTDSVLGNVMGLVAVTGFAAFTVVARKAKGQSTTPCVVYGGILGSVAALAIVLSEDGPVWIGWTDLMLCLAMGFAQIGLGFVFYTWGAQRLPAAEAALLALSEVVVGPLWVWLVYAEVPSEHAMVGGLILLGAVAYQAASGLRKQRPPVGIV